MTKSNLLHALPPVVALVILLSLWASNRTAARELERLSTNVHTLEETPPIQRGPLETGRELAGNPEVPTKVVATTQEPPPAELPPLVVPGTMDDLGHTIAAVILKQLEFDRVFGDGHNAPEPGSVEFEPIAKELESMIQSITPITAGMQVLSAELHDPVESGRCLAVIAGDLIELTNAEIDVIAQRLGELRTQHLQGGDPDLLNRSFFEGSRDLISESQAGLLRQNLGDDFPSMPLKRLQF